MYWLAHGEVLGFALGEFGFTLYRFDSGDKRNDYNPQNEAFRLFRTNRIIS